MVPEFIYVSVEVVLLGVGRGCDVIRVDLGGRRDVIGVSPNLLGVKGHSTEIGVRV